MRTAVIVNLNAAAFRAKPGLAHEVERAAQTARVHRTRSLGELEAAAREIASAGSERVVLCGGDGTLMAGVSALVETCGAEALPELVPAPGGAAATVGKAFGQRVGLVETVRRATTGGAITVTERPSLAVREASGLSRVGFIFGTGLVARFFVRYYAAGAGGYRGAAGIVARVFVGSFVADAYSRSVLDPLPCKLEVDGIELRPHAYSLIVSSVIRDLGLHMLVTHRGGEDFERPHLVASPLSPRRLGPQAPLVLLGKRLRGRDNFDELVGRFRVSFDGSGPYVLDGDLLHAESVEVSAGPRLRVGVARRLS